MTRAIRIPAGALVVGLALIGAGQAAAHRTAARHHANTFAGTCQLSGTIAFMPPLTNTPQPLTQRARATGTCSGTFTGRNGREHTLANAPVS